MTILDLTGYIAALLIGVVLGLTGGGGSILTVPVLVYLLTVNPVTATAYSLFVVGTSSLVGALQNMRKQLVDLRTAAVFAVPSFVAVYITRKFIVPAIPEKIFSIGGFLITKEIGIMLFFAAIMVVASLSMIRENPKEELMQTKVSYNYPLIIIEGLVVGVLTGIVGAGGGFLIIPALVLLAKLPMKKAVATSLLIISVKSLIGFIGDVETMQIDWLFLLVFSGIAVAGTFLGVYLSRFVNGEKLKRGFGWLILVMGIYIIWQEVA